MFYSRSCRSLRWCLEFRSLRCLEGNLAFVFGRASASAPAPNCRRMEWWLPKSEQSSLKLAGAKFIVKLGRNPSRRSACFLAHPPCHLAHQVGEAVFYRRRESIRHGSEFHVRTSAQRLRGSAGAAASAADEADLRTCTFPVSCPGKMAGMDSGGRRWSGLQGKRRLKYDTVNR